MGECVEGKLGEMSVSAVGVGRGVRCLLPPACMISQRKELTSLSSSHQNQIDRWSPNLFVLGVGITTTTLEYAR